MREPVHGDPTRVSWVAMSLVLALVPLMVSCAPQDPPPTGALPGFRHVTRYDPEQREATYKVFTHVLSEDGKVVLTKGPGGDFSHHRGFFVGWNKTRSGDESWDFWHCGKGETIRHREYTAVRRDSDRPPNRLEATAVWRTPDGVDLVREARRIAVGRDEATGARILDFTVILEALAGKVALRGDPQHGGCQFRAAQEVHDRPKETIYLRSPGARGGADDVWRDCDWVAMSFQVQGRDFTVLFLDHPDNKHPRVWSTRQYGRFGVYRELDLVPGEPRPLRFRLLVFDHGAEQGVRSDDRLLTSGPEEDRPLLLAAYQELFETWTKPAGGN